MVKLHIILRAVQNKTCVLTQLRRYCMIPELPAFHKKYECVFRQAFSLLNYRSLDLGSLRSLEWLL